MPNSHELDYFDPILGQNRSIRKFLDRVRYDKKTGWQAYISKRNPQNLRPCGFSELSI